MRAKPFTIATLLALALLTGCARRTHHTLIRLEQPPDRVFSVEKNEAEFREIVSIMEAWAKAEGFTKIAPEQGAAARQSWHSTAANGNEQTLYYRESVTGDKRWPIEVMLAFDPDEDTVYAQISASEGYGRKPSPRLQSIHGSLTARLEKRYGKNIKASIW